MASPIPDSHVDLLTRPVIAHLATIMPDGSVQVTPVWCDLHDGHVRVNSTRGRRKDRNIRRDPRVALSLCDPDSPGRYLEVRGRVVDIREDGGIEHIDALARAYLGVDTYANRSREEIRVIYTIAPERFSKMG